MHAKHNNSFLLHSITAVCLFSMCLNNTEHAAAEENPVACSTLASTDNQLLLQEIICMSDEELGTLRGGFIQNNQIVIGFGFERVVRVDGEIQEHILAGLPIMNLPNNIQLIPINRSVGSDSNTYLLEGDFSGRIISERTLSEGALSRSTPQIQIVPSTLAFQELMNNVIQNNLDNKTIDQIRVINIDVMGLGGNSRFDRQMDLNPAVFENLGF